MIAAVVLAAGAASRFGAPKQRLFLPAVVAALRATASVDEIVVVTGAYRLEIPGVHVAFCAEWARGPGASLRCGLRSLGDDAEAAVVVLADGPRLSRDAIERVLAAWREGESDVVAASYGGDRGHPVLVGRAAWHAIPDEGARSLEAALVPCDDLGPPGDVDTPEDM